MEGDTKFDVKAFAGAFQDHVDDRTNFHYEIDRELLESIASRANKETNAKCIATMLLLDEAVPRVLEEGRTFGRCKVGLGPGDMLSFSTLVGKCFAQGAGHVRASLYETKTFPGFVPSCYQGLGLATRRLEKRGFGLEGSRGEPGEVVPEGGVVPDLLFLALVGHMRKKTASFLKLDKKQIFGAVRKANEGKRPKEQLLGFLEREVASRIQGEGVPNCACKFLCDCDCEGSGEDSNPYLFAKTKGPVICSGRSGCKCREACACGDGGYERKDFAELLDEVAGYEETGDWVADAVAYDRIAYGGRHEDYLADALRRLEDKGFGPP